MSTREVNGQNVGRKIVEIKGVVIDAVFPETLPEINNARLDPSGRTTAAS